jgi:hypothetical protein
LLGKAQSPFSFNPLEILHGRQNTDIAKIVDFRSFPPERVEGVEEDSITFQEEMYFLKSKL